MNFINLLPIAGLVGAGAFWWVCVRPALLPPRASTATSRAALGLTVVTMVGQVIGVTAVGRVPGSSVAWWIWFVTGIAYVVAILAGHPRYALLRRSFR